MLPLHLMEYDIFISYSRTDSAIVNTFVQQLEAADYKVWIDRAGVYSGSQFKSMIVKAIEDSKVFLFFSSKDANASPWTAKEIAIAANYQKTIIPIKLDNTRYNGTVEFDLINLDYVDYINKSNRVQEFDKLMRTLKTLLGKIQTHTPLQQQQTQTQSQPINTTMKYDVFISSKSEDYGLAEKVYDFLIESGLDVFLASRELDRLGESEYSLAIDDAIDNATHMIVVATSVDNINSKWVKYEWNTFSNDLKSGYRTGNLITIHSHDIELRRLPASLRHQQSFWLDTYKQHILSYLKDDNSVLAAKLKEAQKEIKRLEGIIKTKDHEIMEAQDDKKRLMSIITSKNDEIKTLKKKLKDATAKIKEPTAVKKTIQKPTEQEKTTSTLFDLLVKNVKKSQEVIVLIKKNSVRAMNDLSYVLSNNSLSLSNAQISSGLWRMKVKDRAAAQKLIAELRQYHIRAEIELNQ